MIRNEHNYAELMKLKKEAEIYQNIEYTDVYAKDELYDIMTEIQLINLINYIKINSFIPVKYFYLGDGANIWDEIHNTINETKDDEIKKYGIESDKHILTHAFSFFKEYFNEFDTINLIDLGPGNCYSSIPVI